MYGSQQLPPKRPRSDAFCKYKVKINWYDLIAPFNCLLFLSCLSCVTGRKMVLYQLFWAYKIRLAKSVFERGPAFYVKSGTTEINHAVRSLQRCISNVSYLISACRSIIDKLFISALRLWHFRKGEELWFLCGFYMGRVISQDTVQDVLHICIR